MIGRELKEVKRDGKTKNWKNFQKNSRGDVNT
jgi:hypothetical protein